MKKATRSMNLLFITSAALVVVGGVLLSACQPSSAPDQGAPAATATATAAPAATMATLVEVSVGNDGFQPSNIALKKGQPATLRFTRTSDETCAKKVVFPDISVERDLPLNKPVDVEVPTTEARELTFQCGMGMYKSKVVVGG